MVTLPAHSLVRVLLDPAVGVAAAVQRRRFKLALALLVVSVAGSGAAVAVRLDPTPAILSGLEAAGELATVSGREVSEKVVQARRLGIVAGVAQGLFGAPLAVLLGAVGLKLFAWLMARRLPFRAALSTVALAALPLAVGQLYRGAAALAQSQLTAGVVAELVPSSLAALVQHAPPHLRPLLGAVDLFILWAAALLGLGYAAGTGLSRWRGLVAGFALYALFAAVFLIGLPGLVAAAVSSRGVTP